jgi:putative endonuclease
VTTAHRGCHPEQSEGSNKLVYFEETRDVAVAIAREKEIKKWRREKKNSLVFNMNPEWKDLSRGL